MDSLSVDILSLLSAGTKVGRSKIVSLGSDPVSGRKEREKVSEKVWGARGPSLLPSTAPICSESAGGALFTPLCVCARTRVCLRRGGARRKGQ